MRKHAPSWAAFDIRMMFQAYLERGFVAEEGDAGDVDKTPGPRTRTYEDFAKETMREWQKLDNPASGSLEASSFGCRRRPIPAVRRPESGIGLSAKGDCHVIRNHKPIHRKSREDVPRRNGRRSRSRHRERSCRVPILEKDRFAERAKIMQKAADILRRDADALPRFSPWRWERWCPRRRRRWNCPRPFSNTMPRTRAAARAGETTRQRSGRRQCRARP